MISSVHTVADEDYLPPPLQCSDSAATLDLPGHKHSKAYAKPAMLDAQTLREYGALGKRASSIASAMASRETSPERSSIASFRIGSRPGTASQYSTADVKKLYCAGPRSFTPGNLPRPGLQTGDVVAFLAEGGAYAASQAEVLEEEPSKTNFVFQLTSSNDLLSDKAAHLEVVRQGDWIGFRSAAAEDKFLQSRRHGKHRLGFFNSNLGTWEQWEVVPGEPKQAWNLLHMGLRNRRLPQVVLTIDVVRVGSYAMLPNSTITPRSLIPLEGDVSENEELMKMSGLMIYEWFHFVDKEKQVRIKIDGKVNQMITDAAELRAWTIAEIQAIRSEMDIEVNRLIAIIHKKNSDLTELESKLVKRMKWGAMVLQSRNANLIKRQVLIWWRKVAEYQRSCAFKVARQLQRRSQMQQTTAFLVWLRYCHHCRNMRAGMQQLVRRVGHERLSTAFSAWSGCVSAATEAREMMREVQQQAIVRVQRWRIGFLLCHWHKHTQSCKAGRQRLQQLHTHAQQQRQATVFAAWRERAGQVTILLHMGNTLAGQVQKRRMQSWLKAWHLHCLHRRWQQQVLARAEARRAHSSVLQTFQAWSHYITSFRLRKEAFAVRWTKEVQYLQRRALYKWRFAVADARRIHHAGHQIQRRHTLRSLWSTFSAWRAAAQRHRHCQQLVVKALHRRTQGQTRFTFYAWQQLTRQQGRNNRVAAHHFQQIQHGLLQSVFASWHQHAARQHHYASKVQRCRQSRHHLLLQTGLQAFIESAQLRRAQDQIVQKSASQAKARLLRHVFQSWQEYVQVDCAQLHAAASQAARQLAQRQQASVFSGWFALHQQQRDDSRSINFCRRRAARRQLQCIWQGWQQTVQHRSRVRQYLSIAVARISHNTTAAAFTQWQGYVQASVALRTQQEQAVQRVQLVRLQHIFQAWYGQTRQRQQLKGIAMEIMARSSQNMAAVAFRAWRHTLASKTEAHGIMQRVIVRLQSVRTFQAFDAWQAFVQQQQAQKGQLQRAVARLQRLRGSDAFYHWQELVAQRNAVQARLARFARQQGQRSMASAFAAWSQHSFDMRQARQTAQVMANRAARSCLTVSFHAWQQDAAHAQRVLQAAHSMMARTQHASQAAAFDGWLETVDVLRHNRRIASQAARRISNIRLSQVFHRWREQAETLQAARSSAGRIAAHMRNQTLAAAFHTWAEAVMLNKSQSNRADQLAESAVSRAHFALLNHCLEAWREGAEERVSRRQQAVSKLQSVAVSQQYRGSLLPSSVLLQPTTSLICLAAVMHGWSNAVQLQKRHASLLERHARRRSAAVQMASFRALRDFAQFRLQRKTALLRLFTKNLVKRKREAFNRWYAAWQENRQALERLRACITRKRISFRLYKHFYWQTFDDDMQATMGHMYNTAEEAINSPLPSRDEILGSYSPHASGQPSQGLLALPTHSSLRRVTDYSRLYNSPAGTGTEILVLEGQDGSHVNLTQSRFSRYASEINGSLNPFQATSQAFRSSVSEQAWHLSGHEADSLQHAVTTNNHSSVAGPAFTDSPDNDSIALWQSKDVVADTPGRAAHEHVSHRTPTHQTQTQSPAASYGSVHMSSQASARLSSVSNMEVQHVSSSRKVRNSALEVTSARSPLDSTTKSAQASFARSSSRLPASPLLGAHTQQNDHSPSSPYGEQVHESWAGEALSNSGSVYSPEHDSSRSQVASTPAKAEMGVEAGTPDHRKLASSIAHLASAAALARSPGLANAGTTSGLKTQLSDRMSNPEMRTPRTFFNPSFDETQSP